MPAYIAINNYTNDPYIGTQTETPHIVGSIGYTGPTGMTGIMGVTGATGCIGPCGPEGPTGPSGCTGEPGPCGPEGVTGPTGPEGPQGPQGPVGPMGVTGPTGPMGDNGDEGSDGPQGAAGPLGPTYDQYGFMTDSTQNIPNNTVTVVTYSSTPLFSNLSSAISGSGIFQVSSNGLYMVTGYAAFTENTVADRTVILNINGSAAYTVVIGACPDNTTCISASQVLSLSSGQMVSMSVNQTSGGSLALTAASLSIIQVA